VVTASPPDGARPHAASGDDGPTGEAGTPAAGDLLGLAAELVAVPSVSGNEGALADLVEARLRRCAGLEVRRVGHNVVARSARGAPTRVLLAGHLDTVPPAGNERAVVRDGWLSGVGSADMKGGLAVMLALAERLSGGGPADCPGRRRGGGAGDFGARVGATQRAGAWPGGHDVTLCFYACEEVARSRSGLREIACEDAGLLDADAAVLLEPTGGVVEAGCQGVLRLTLRLRGKRAHVARPWTGENAVHRLGPVLEVLRRLPARRPLIDGCEYRESLAAVGVAGVVAGNVVPDRAELSLSYRFAPDRDPDEAYAAVAGLCSPVFDPDRDELVVEDVAPAAAPSLGHPLLAALVQESGAAPRGKLGWTDVATFAERGVPAANFGPGDPLLAHRADERVSAEELDDALVVLERLLLRQPAGPPT
jgi:succinyl-diaminopimelate desuccinylase